MLIFVNLLFISAGTLPLGLLVFSAKVSPGLHSWCLSQIPTDHSWRHNTASLVCGSEWLDTQLKPAFEALGLLHIMVISGSHLGFLMAGLERLGALKNRRVRWTILATLGAYVFMTRFQPPIVRAWIQYALDEVRIGRKTFWRPDQRVYAAGCLCLCAMPDWWSSLSLLLSWGASLALTLTRGSRLLQAAAVYILLWPLCWPLGPSSPVSILANWIFAPILGAVLFPLSLLVMVVPPCAVIVDLLWDGPHWLLSPLERGDIQNFSPGAISTGWLWIYLFAIHGGLHLWHVRRLRQVAA